MIDIFFIGTIINIFWQIFTVLFILYRFTTFFNVMLGFIKFCGRIFEGIDYIKNSICAYFVKRNGYSVLNTDELEESNFTPKNSFFKKCWYYFIPKKQTTELPFHDFLETRESYAMHPLYDSNYSTSNGNFYSQLKNMSDTEESNSNHS
jgi:hypothetical protein